MKVDLWRGYVSEVVHDGLTPFESIARLKEISIDYSELNDGEEYLFDAEKIHTVFSILLSYAVKSTPVGSVILFTSDYLEKDEDYTYFIFTVEDSDKGITSDKLPFNFNRSYQMDSSDSSNYDKPDMNLPVAKELVELMGGNLTVESESGKGTTFILQLLLRKASSENVPFYEPDIM